MSTRRRLSAAIAAAIAGLAVVAAGAPAAAPTVRFVNFGHPGDTYSAEEPSIGVDQKTGGVLYQAGITTYNVSGFQPATGESTWTRATAITTSVDTLDPILETDAVSGRTFVSQLTGVCSLMAYTDDDGKSWTDVPNGCPLGSAFDHQSVGTGAFVDGGALRPATGYDRAVYYCSQAGYAVNCGTSIDGGRSFLPATHAWTFADGCSGLHGHIASAPDGTVYVPPDDCDGEASVVSSADNGLTWSLHHVDGTHVGSGGDPSIAADAASNVYFAWPSDIGDGAVPTVSVGRGRGEQWGPPHVLGREFRINNVRFPAVVAGDAGRAAVAFLGTSTRGYSEAEDFAGVWRLYVAFTYDGGRTWRTVLATPESPVQVGRICMLGVLCPNDGSRNLLDFMDATLDPQGRILVSFADGCLEQMCDSRARNRRPTISRQQSGKGLFAKYDGQLG
ncbi:MAG: sialidase family protein [Mycobacteriales bacterium]